MSEGARRHDHDFFSMWQRTMEQGFQGWSRAAAPPGLDVLQFWMQLFLRGLETWVQTLQQGGTVQDAMVQWKKFTDESVEHWSKVLGGAMDTEEFAAASGRLLDQILHVVGPLRTGLQAGSEEFCRTVNLPSRKQVTGLAAQIVAIDARLEAMEDRLGELAASLKSLEVLIRRPAAEQGPDAERGGRPEASRAGKAGRRRRDA
jgi:hypothetical protein